MQEREKKLAIMLGAVVAVWWFLLPLVEGWFVGPITAQRAQLELARTQFTEREERKLQLFKAQSDLRNWRYESLPPNPLTAQREYQEWLMDLVVMSGWSSPQPTLGRRSPTGNTYVQIPVTIKARATFAQLARFLYHAERVALLHRIDSLKLTSPSSTGDPLVDVELTAIGLSLPDADDRQHLFPRTSLTADLSADDTSATIAPPQGFPLVAGFQVKVGEELMSVQSLDGSKWTVERGAEGTIAAAHPAGADVEFFPVDRAAASRSFDDYLSLLENSPFTKPSPPMEYRPAITPESLAVVTRGTPWQTKFSVTGWDPAGGPPAFSLVGDGPGGLQLDAESGVLTWSPDESIPAGEYEVQVRAASHLDPGQAVTVTLPITLRDPNLPPVIGDLKPVTVYSGRPMSLTIPASDPDGQSLTFALSGTVPEGVAVDSKTGELTWTPPLTMELGDYSVTVTVKDAGDPQQTTTAAVSLTVAEDAALFTRYVGYFGEDGKPEAFLYNQATNEKTSLVPGETLEVADIEAQVVDIARDHVELQIGTERFRLPLGKNLRQLLPIVESSAEDAANRR